jgi:CheY-like chemotaxis protein
MPIAQTCLPGETILVADNDAIARLAIAGYRGDCGVRVVEAAGGAEARSVPQHGPAICVLMIEARLGNESTFGLAQWARRHSPGFKVIIIAGLNRKSETAARLCPGRQTPAPPASHIRERIEGMPARHAHRAHANRRTRARITPGRAA